MGRKDALPRDEMVDYVMSCWDDEAGKSDPLRLPSERSSTTSQSLSPLGLYHCEPSRAVDEATCVHQVF
jgi:hypothetical protein